MESLKGGDKHYKGNLIRVKAKISNQSDRKRREK
jgi:hypothetical protein